MKSSELIKELAERINMYGDLDVVLWGLAYPEDKMYLVDVTAEISEDGNPMFIELQFDKRIK
jgi:hypothetical protein